MSTIFFSLISLLYVYNIKYPNTKTKCIYRKISVKNDIVDLFLSLPCTKLRKYLEVLQILSSWHVTTIERGDYGTVCHENLFKFTQTTSGRDVAIGAVLITWHAPAVSRPSDSQPRPESRLAFAYSANILNLNQI